MPIYKTGKTKDGKVQYRVFISYTDATGKYRKKSKTVYGAAEAKLEEMRMNHEIGTNWPTAPLTIGELYNEYITVKKNEIRQSSLEKSISILKNNILPYLADVQLEDLSIKELQKWKNTIAEKDTMVRSKNNAFSELRALLNYAVKMEYIHSHQMARLGRFRDPYFTHEQEALHYYTAEEFRKFIAVAEQYKDRSINDSGFYVFFNIAYLTGMRKGEINSLKWSDIEGNLIHVRRSISQKTKGGDQETPPKNKSSYRTLQMPQKLVLILEQHRLLQKQIKGFSSDFRVCGGVSPLRDSSIERKNIQYAKEAELQHIRIHDFRHSHASLLANEGINIQEIARRLGHSNVQQTWQTYSHLYPREEERALAVLDTV
jgi:integrase